VWCKVPKPSKPVQFDLDRDVWERQPRESDKAWAAFCYYRDMEPRSTRKAAVALGKSGSMVSQWSHRWRWQDRIRAWDNHLNGIYQAEREKAQKEMAKNHIKLAKGVQAKVAQRLQSLQPQDISAGEMGRLLDVAVKIERLASGVPTEHTKTEVEGQVNIKHEYGVAARIFADDEARQLYLALMARLYMVEPDPSGPRDAREPGEVEIL